MLLIIYNIFLENGEKSFKKKIDKLRHLHNKYDFYYFRFWFLIVIQWNNITAEIWNLLRVLILELCRRDAYSDDFWIVNGYNLNRRAFFFFILYYVDIM